MEDIFSYFTFSAVELVCLAVFFVIVLIQILIYLLYYRKPVAYFNKMTKNGRNVSSGKPSVSVIIVSKNESENLERNLPHILNQDYPDFEVVVVNDGSTDESDMLLRRLSHSYSNLYHTFSPDSRDRKLSMTIAIKAAKNEVLLFTEANCRPVSNQWISSIMENMTEGKDVVLGYSRFVGKPAFFQRLANFDNLLFSLQYLSKAIKNKPYTGTYRNIAFKREMFFKNKGFSAVLNYDNCEDVFVNRIVTQTNTAVALDQDSFTEMELESFSAWKGIKAAYMRAKNNFMNIGFPVFGLETLTRYLFYLIFISLLAYGIYSQNWVFTGIVGFFFLLRIIIQLVVINKSSKHFETFRFYLSLIPIDLLQPYYNAILRFGSRKKDSQRYRSTHM